MEYYQSLRYGFDDTYDPPLFDDDEEIPDPNPKDSKDLEE